MANENKKITLVESAFALPDSESEFGMKIADHKLLCRILDAHEGSIDEKNSELHDKLISDVNEVIKDQWIRVLKEELAYHTAKLNNTLIGIKDKIGAIERRLGAEEKEMELVEKRLGEKKLRIEKLEIKMELFQPETIKEIKDFIKEFEEVKPYFLAWGKIFDWFKLKNLWKMVLIFIAILVLFFGLIWLSHKLNWVTESGIKQGYGIDDIYSSMRNGTMSMKTRAIHPADLSKLSKAQRDSATNAQHKANIQAIMKTIK